MPEITRAFLRKLSEWSANLTMMVSETESAPPDVGALLRF